MSENVIRQNVADAAEEYSKIFGANKNLYRIVPSFQDGLRPGKRRLFWAWWILDHKTKDASKCTFKKVSTIAGATMNYHPHGDVATVEVIAKEGQYWNNNVMTVTPQGNFGGIRGDEHAGSRYIEAKLSEYVIDCFFADFSKCSVPMKDTYTGTEKEPEYLPAKYPHVLFNPQIAGIGYALASNIPPFNVKEVLNATINLIRDEKAKVKLVPDSPTGADIVDTGDGFKEINKTGRGSFTLQSTVEIDYIKNVIKVTSLPLQISTKGVIDVIVNGTKSKQFEEVIGIDDYTKNGEVDFRIYLRQEANPDKVLKKLYKKTDMRKTYPVDLVMVDDYREHRYGIKEFLLEWIEYRRDSVRAMYNISLQQAIEKQHLNDVLLFVLNEDNAEKTLDICRKASSRRDTVEKLCKYYKGQITHLQAETICDMKLSAFTKDSYKRYKEDKVYLKNEIKRITDILDDDNAIDEHIVGELREGIKKYGRPRMSHVISEKEEELVTSYKVGISRDGYIKKLPIDAESIGKVGKKVNAWSTIYMPVVLSSDKILLVCSNGEIVPIKTTDIPDLSYDDIGISIVKFINPKYQKTGDDLEVMGSLLLPKRGNVEESKCLIIATWKGIVKRIPISEFAKSKKPTTVIKLDEDDRVADAVFTLDNSVKDIIISTINAKGIRYHISDIPIQTKTAKGKRLIALEDKDYIVNISKIDPKCKYLFMITSSGKAKLTEMRYFPSMKKRASNLNLMALDTKEILVGVSSVNLTDSIEIYKRNSAPITINAADIKIKTRIAKGEKMIKTTSGDNVLSYRIVKE